jgi:hypothetical protein
VNLVALMDELAARLDTVPSLAGKTYGYPPAKLASTPAAIVTYPTDGAYDATYGRGTDSMTGVVVVVVGRPTDRTARDRVGGYIAGSGPESMKGVLDADGYASCDGVRVTGWETDVYSIGDIEYLTAVFSLEIYGPGEG